MSNAPGIPQNLNVQTANQVILVSWDLSAGATSYLIERSLDNVTFASLVTLSGTPLATSYLDSAVILGTQYFYKVAASNGATSGYTSAKAATPTPTGEMTLGQIRDAAMQRADLTNSKSVTKPEWRNYINQSMYELYDLLITTYEDYFIAPPIQFVSNGTTSSYSLPNGSNTFQSAQAPYSSITPRPFYKLIGVDLGISNANNAFVSVNKFNFIDRNKYTYPNSSSSIYGALNLQYRVMGNSIQLIPTPGSGQTIKLWYIPRLIELLQDTDTTDVGISGWIEYVIVKAAYYALTKEESDTTSLVMQLGALQKRIEESAANRDAGMPDTISDTRGNGGFNGGFGSMGGF